MTKHAIGLIAIVLLSTVAAPAALATTGGSASAQATEGSASGESSLTFETSGSAIVDYAVGGDTVAESIRVQSQSGARADLSLSVGADLTAVTGLDGAGLSTESTGGLQTTVQAESGATVTAHDNGQGSLVVSSDGEAQYVEVGLAPETSAEADGDGRVVVTTEEGTTGAVLATGDASVTVNDEGNVSAAVEGDDRLVFRAYPDGREEADRETEDLITSGSAAASVFLTGDGSDAVTYDGHTAVSVTQQTEGHVEMAVERSAHDGKVVVTRVAEGTFESAEDVQVTVDGEATARASSVAELERATEDGDNSRYLVWGDGGADASMDVLVGVNHFSTRDVAVSEAGNAEDGSDDTSDGTDGQTDGSDGTTESDDGSSGDGSDAGVENDGGGDDATGANGPGFGALAAVVGVLAGAALLGRCGR